jgi:hypothetical protein
LGKAKQAAIKIFNIMEKPTEITALDAREQGVQIKSTEFKGTIEF